MSNDTVRRILAYDTSLGVPGVGLIEIKRGEPKIIDMSHVKTDTKQPIALRASIVESWSTLFIAKHVKRGFDVVGREDFHGQSSLQNYPVFAAWHATERSVNSFGLSFDKFVSYTKIGNRKQGHGVSQSRAKMLIVGRGGKVSKDEVADAVREWTGYDGDFADDGESDAICIALAFAVQRGWLLDRHGKLNEFDIASQ